MPNSIAMTPEETAQKQLAEYEIERGKPMPSLNHGIIQSNLCFAIQATYRKEYRGVGGGLG